MGVKQCQIYIFALHFDHHYISLRLFAVCVCDSRLRSGYHVFYHLRMVCVLVFIVVGGRENKRNNNSK